ncbi:Uncharacterized protein TCM_019895 [Theobroma cacao]|uniref:Uncharacterized protein n=1 Tax=Theobroma cacao TaxID=3641 RepID=A0A061EQY8_THECC|nr:Uncharacterized protein TCM_019895 [Theobroma cacao]
MWKDVVSLKEVEGLLSYMGTEGCQWLLGKGKKIMSWLDDWLPDKPLKVFFPTTLFPGIKEDEEIINVGQHLGHKAADNDGEIMEKMVQLENESTKAL